jgi:hypothetical protein
MNAWSDFSISVSRTYLKPIALKAIQIGAGAGHPVPFFVGFLVTVTQTGRLLNRLT